jgi:hypothetical protein
MHIVCRLARPARTAREVGTWPAAQVAVDGSARYLGYYGVEVRLATSESRLALLTSTSGLPRRQFRQVEQVPRIRGTVTEHPPNQELWRVRLVPVYHRVLSYLFIPYLLMSCIVRQMATWANGIPTLASRSCLRHHDGASHHLLQSSARLDCPCSSFCSTVALPMLSMPSRHTASADAICLVPPFV